MNVLLNVMRNLGPVRLASIGAVMMGIIGFFIYLTTHTATPDMGLLFHQVDPAEGAKIMDKLETMGIQGEIRGDSSIYVPADRVARLRMEMAQEGLPSGGVVGYEIFDKTDVLGTSGSLVDINHVRATEGEIAKSIKTISGVAAARVHLVMPKRELFSREKTEPSASIVLKMKGAMRLSSNQVQAIQHLVASAVSGLPVDKIAIIDDKGTLLAKNRERGEAGANAAAHHDTRTAFEDKTAKTIEGLLEQTVGIGKARAEVTADMDFGRLTINSEEFNPDGQVVRSTTNSEEGANSNNGSGAGEGVTVQNALPPAPGATPASSSSSNNKRSEETVNYEISRTTRTEVKESGTLKKLSVAVLVDGVYTKGTDGKETYAPRAKEEIEQITNLVKTAIGFNKERGDTVEVVNMKFSHPDTSESKDAAEPGQSWMPAGGLGHLMEMGVLAVVGFLVMMMVVRPIVLKILESAPAQMSAGGGIPSYQSDSLLVGADPATQSMQAIPGAVQSSAPAGADRQLPLSEPNALDSLIDIDHIEGRVKASSIKKIGEIIEKHPEEAVAIMRNWMYAQP